MCKEKRIWLCLFLFVLASGNMGMSEEREKFRPGFHLKFTGGGFQAGVGDMNTHLDSVNDFYRHNYQVEASGGIETIGHLSSEWQIEAIWDISPKIRYGLAVSQFTHFQNESIYRYADIQTYRIDREIMFRPEIEVSVLARLSLYYSIYSARRISIYLHSGVGLYSAWMKERMSAKLVYPRGDVYYQDRSWSAEQKAAFGWHGGISAEYNLGKNLALVAELQGRYLKMNDLRGSVEYTTNFGTGLTIGEGGSLHFFGTGQGYYDMDIPLPAHFAVLGSWQYIERKAVLDLSGFSFRIGIRIWIL